MPAPPPSRPCRDPEADRARDAGPAEDRRSQPDARRDRAQPEPVERRPPTSYTVKRGDTLSGIAATYGTTIKKLAALNHIADPSKLHVGQVLKLP